jgi:hypothetical protein
MTLHRERIILSHMFRHVTQRSGKLGLIKLTEIVSQLTIKTHACLFAKSITELELNYAED